MLEANLAAHIYDIHHCLKRVYLMSSYIHLKQWLDRL